MPMSFERIPFARGEMFRLLRWTDNVHDVELCLPEGRTQPITGAGESWHYHPEVELTLVTRGHGRRFVGDHLASFQAPDLVLIGSNLPHYWSGLTGSSGYALQFVPDADHPLWQLAATSRLRSLNDLASCGVQISGAVVDRIRSFMESMAGGDAVRGFIGFLEILSTIGSVGSQHLRSLSMTRFSFTDRDPHVEAINRAVKYIMREMRSEIRLQSLLKVTHMSRPTFCRQFKRHTGRTLIEFVNQVRVDHARRLLVESNLPVTSVAFKSGFTNLSHFNRQFFRFTRCSPRDFRKLQAVPDG